MVTHRHSSISLSHHHRSCASTDSITHPSYKYPSSPMHLSFFDHRNDEGGKKISAFLSALLSPYPFSPLYSMKELSKGFCSPFDPPSLPSITNESIMKQWIDQRKPSQWRGTLAALLSFVQINQKPFEEKIDETFNHNNMMMDNTISSQSPAFLSSILIYFGNQLLLSHRPAAATLCFIAADSPYNVLYSLGIRAALNGINYRLFAHDRSIDPLREAIFYLLIRSKWNSYSLNDCNNNNNNNNNNMYNHNSTDNHNNSSSLGNDLIMATLMIDKLFTKTFGGAGGCNEEMNESEWKSIIEKYNEKFSKFIGISSLLFPPTFSFSLNNNDNNDNNNNQNDDPMEEDISMFNNNNNNSNITNNINFDSPLSFGYSHRHRFAEGYRLRTSESETFSQWITPSSPSPSHMSLDSRSSGKELSLFSAYTNEINRLNDKEIENFTPYIFKVIPPSPIPSLSSLVTDENDHFLSSFDSSPPSPSHSLASFCSSPASSIASPPSSGRSTPRSSSPPSFSPLPPSAYRHLPPSSSSHWLSSVRSSHPRLFIHLPHIHHHWLVSGTGIIRYLSRYYSEIDENHLEISLGNISSRVWKIKGKELHEGLFLLNTKLEFIDTKNHQKNSLSSDHQNHHHSPSKNSSNNTRGGRSSIKRSSAEMGKIKCKTEVYMPKEALSTILNYENNDQRLRHMFGEKTVDALRNDVMNYLMMIDDEAEDNHNNNNNEVQEESDGLGREHYHSRTRTIGTSS